MDWLAVFFIIYFIIVLLLVLFAVLIQFCNCCRGLKLSLFSQLGDHQISRREFRNDHVIRGPRRNNAVQMCSSQECSLAAFESNDIPNVGTLPLMSYGYKKHESLPLPRSSKTSYFQNFPKSISIPFPYFDSSCDSKTKFQSIPSPSAPIEPKTDGYHIIEDEPKNATSSNKYSYLAKPPSYEEAMKIQISTSQE